MQGVSEHKNGDTWSKQPRPLEDGNWICEDLHCNNVNYPRRTECHKCKKKRGPIGDAVVRAYQESLKMGRGEIAQPMTMSHHRVSSQDCVALGRAMFPQFKDFECRHLAMLPNNADIFHDYDPWVGPGLEQIPSVGLQYIVRDRGLHGWRSIHSIATEGKRLAEHLVASFAASSDPIGDAGECLASAAIWLQNMKSRVQAEEGAMAAAPLLSGIPMPPLSGMNGGPNIFFQSRNVCIGSMAPRPNSSLANMVGPAGLHRTNVRWETCKDQPSDFLREYGDPTAMTASVTGGCPQPEPGVHGNWECECKNANFPRRTSCFQCHKKRGPKGDEIVQKYVHCLFEKSEVIQGLGF